MEQHEFDGLIELLRKKAVAGDAQAARDLGDVYYQGQSGQEENIAAALPYWRMAANLGDAAIAHKVGFALFNGNGCQKDYAEALQYFTMAAEAGIVEAQLAAGLSYLHGFGCEENEGVAIEYLEQAAIQGNTKAQWTIGHLLYSKNRGDWLHWVCCAHLGGEDEATDVLNHLLRIGYDRDKIDLKIRLIKSRGLDPDNTRILGEHCYIATAVYGSYEAPEVRVLRRFRDEVLKESALGRAFIRVYYHVSPPLAERLKSMKRMNSWVRKRLDGLVARLRTKRGF